ncbi:diguanylate cyclase with PAS/PAC sensor and hemerythrin-like metal-binding domain [Sideroxydans lithotrophicus ES-1]|uniref:Diguanylate cyclase with PAS/PAC sensor and hemerythrin-like metal-binding domain n=1 Tax=Sideroxydans lithotrophicus (strain ES-1) TaxID=580332 RepID=D5CLZ5_SIDLE|nr:diguanylate cyclase with PAS/PAC sensor and hemerythrin-like metal-binding domain [Sideroxydans lithotrophicus ES-1]
MDSQSGRSSSDHFAIYPISAFVILVIVALLMGDHLFSNLRAGLKNVAQQNVVAIGSIKASQIGDWLHEHESDVKTLSDNSFFSREAIRWIRGGAKDPVRRRLIVDRLQSFLNAHHFRAIVLYDSTGRVLLNVGDLFADDKEIGIEARRAVESGQFRFVDLHRDRPPSNAVEMGFISPLHEGLSYAGAVYLVEDPASYLLPLVDSRPGGSETADTQLVRAEGNDVLYLNQLRDRDDPPLGYRLPLSTPGLAVAIALRGKQGLIEGANDHRGRPVFSYAGEIAGTPWVLVSKIDEAEAYRMVDQVRWLAGLLFLFTSGLIAAWFRQWRRRDLAEAEAAILKERVRADALKMEGEKRFRTAFEHTALPMVRNSLTGEFIEVNDAWCNMFGYSRDEVSSKHLDWQQVTYPDDMEPGATLVKQMLAGEISDFKIEKRYLQKDGKVLWGSVQVKLVRDEQGVPEFVISAIQDITERKLTEKTINFMAYHDKLTGLPNRALLFDRLAQAMSQAKRDAKYVALLFADLDGFKAVNDLYGHEAGDNVLKMAAQRFLACVRAVDTVARFGGDEFAIILGNLDDPLQAKGVAEKIVQAFAQSITLSDGRECTVGASVGISIYPDHGSAMDNLMTAADQAMYESKRHGKNTYTFYRGKSSLGSESQWFLFDESMLVGVGEIDEQHRNLAYLVNRLNEALKRDESMESIQQMLDELLVATRHHFDTENRYMLTYNYPEQRDHELEHAQLLNEAQRFKEQISEGRELLVLQSVKDWLLSHIAFSDKKLAAYLQHQGLK